MSNKQSKLFKTAVIVAVSAGIYLSGVPIVHVYNMESTAVVENKVNEHNQYINLLTEKQDILKKDIDQQYKLQRQAKLDNKVKDVEFHKNMNSIENKFNIENGKFNDNIQKEKTHIDSLNNKLSQQLKNPWNSWYEFF
jgi:hypothetical protein